MGRQRHLRRGGGGKPPFNRNHERKSPAKEPEKDKNVEAEKDIKDVPAPETAKVNLSSHTISGDEELTQTNSEREDAKNTKTFTTELAAKAKEFKPSGLALPSVLDEPRMDNLRILHRNIERVGRAMPSASNECIARDNTIPRPSQGKKDLKENPRTGWGNPKEKQSHIRIERAEKRSEQAKPKEYLEITTKSEIPGQNLSQNQTPFEAKVLQNYRELAPQIRYKELLDVLTFYIDPIERTHDPKLTLDILLSKAIKYRSHVIQHADAIDIELIPLIKQKIIKFWRLFCALKYANKGYSADDYFEDFPEALLDIDWRNELLNIECFVKEICSSTINIGDLEDAFAEEKQRDREIMILIEKDNQEELKKWNVSYAATPLIRLIHDAPVTEKEIYEVVQESVTTDYGYFLWLVDKKPEALLGRFDITECVITAIHGKLQSKDQRPLASLISVSCLECKNTQIQIVPRMLQSLTNEEKETLAERYIEEPTIKIKNWPEVLLQGYKMLRFKELQFNQSVARKQVIDTKCVVTAKLLEAESPEDVVGFFFFCSLIAELGEGRFDPVYDYATDSFCTRMGRIALSDIPVSKRELMLQTLMLLPQPIKARLLADGDYPLTTSLYSFADKLVTGGVVINTASKALEIFCQHISPVRIVITYVIPNMEKSIRQRAASLLLEIIKIMKFKDEMLQGTELSPVELCKLAIGQYAEPEPGKPQGRYLFMEQLLNFVDLILAEDIVQRVLDNIDNIISDQKLTWYQHKVILEICFPKSKSKLKQPEVPSVNNDLESLRAANLIAVLYSWPEINKVKPIFVALITDIISKVDSAKLAYVLQVSTVKGGAKTEALKQYVSNFIMEQILPKAVIIKSVDGQNSHTWLKDIVNNKELDKTVRDIVISVARQFRQYENILPRENKPRNAEKSVSRGQASKSSSNNDVKEGGRGGGRGRNNNGRNKDRKKSQQRR